MSTRTSALLKAAILALAFFISGTEAGIPDNGASTAYPPMMGTGHRPDKSIDENSITNPSTHTMNYDDLSMYEKHLSQSRGLTLAALSLLTDAPIGTLWEVSLVHPNFSGDVGTALHGTAKWDLSRTSISLGNRGFAIISAHSFWRFPKFTVMVWVHPDMFVPRRQFVYANWKQPWSYYIGLHPVRDGNKYFLVAELRRNINSDGSNTKQTLVACHGGIIDVGKWSQIGITWNGHRGVLSLYVNGKKVASEMRRVYAGEEEIIQANPSHKEEVGFKKDSMSDFFYGKVRELLTANDVLL